MIWLCGKKKTRPPPSASSTASSETRTASSEARMHAYCRDDVPAEVVAAERETLTLITRNEGKPEAALEKIVEGRIGGFFKDVALLDQPYAKDDKQSVSQFIGSASVIAFAQVEIG